MTHAAVKTISFYLVPHYSSPLLLSYSLFDHFGFEFRQAFLSEIADGEHCAFALVQKFHHITNSGDPCAFQRIEDAHTQVKCFNGSFNDIPIDNWLFDFNRFGWFRQCFFAGAADDAKLAHQDA